MKAWIKYKGSPVIRDDKGNIIGGDLIELSKHNPVRFGKSIPKEKLIEIDILTYFGVKKERGLYIAQSLMEDSRIECKLGEGVKEAVKELQKIPKENLNRNKPLVQKR